MTATFVSVTPALTARIPVGSTFVVTYDNALDSTTVTIQNIIFEDSSNEPIAFALSLSSDGTIVTVNPTASLDNDEVYTLTMTTSILELVSPGAAIVQKDLIFITDNLSDIPVVDLSTDGNVNDIFFEKNRVADVFNIRDVVNEGSKYNFAYTPKFFDPIEQTYSTTSPAQLTFNNQAFIKEKFRGQFLRGFDQYLTNIDDSKITTAADFLDIERVVYPAADQINNSPGLIANITFLTEIYAKAFNYHFVEIVADPIDEFIYYISTNLPIKEWRDTIKGIVHPIGWRDVFVEVASPETAIGAFTFDYRTDIATLVNHGLVDGQLVHVTTTETLPTPLTINTNYYIITSTTNTFQLSLTSGGAAIDLTDNGTGTHTLQVLQYYQTEQYAWTNDYLYGDPENKPVSINQKSFRKGFYVKGNEVAFIVPRVDSSDPPDETPDFTVDSETGEITYTAPADYTLSNVVNYAHDTVLQESGIDGRVLISGASILLTDIDLSSHAVDDMAGQLLFILLSENKVNGQNVDYYTIATNSAAVDTNTITIVETFPLAERDTTFEIHTVGKDVPLSELLAVLNKLQFAERFVFSYLQADQSGTLTDVSRLTFDEFGDLQLIHASGSGVPFTFVSGDITFQYDSDSNPVLFMSSIDFATLAFSFGNVDLENTVEATAVSATSGSFAISDFDEPDSFGLQLVTFDSGEDISTFQATHQLIISAAGGNAGTFFIIDVDYATNTVTIDNPTGAAETVPSGASATHSTIIHHNAWTYILPNTFSFDIQQFNGFAHYLDSIDPCDKTSDCVWRFEYAEYLADIQYPDDVVSSGSDFFTFLPELQDETGNNFQKRVEEGTYKMYTIPSGGLDVSWATGNFIYEYDINSSGGPLSSTGTLFGTVERATDTDLIVKFSGITTDFDDTKYYSNVKRLYNALIISGNDQVDLGSDFQDSLSLEFNRKIVLALNVPDIDTYTWTPDISTETISTDEQFTLFGNSAVTYDITLDVDESQWASPITLSPTLWTNL